MLGYTTLRAQSTITCAFQVYLMVFESCFTCNWDFQKRLDKIEVKSGLDYTQSPASL